VVGGAVVVFCAVDALAVVLGALADCVWLGLFVVVALLMRSSRAPLGASAATWGRWSRPAESSSLAYSRRCGAGASAGPTTTSSAPRTATITKASGHERRYAFTGRARRTGFGPERSILVARLSCRRRCCCCCCCCSARVLTNGRSRCECGPTRSLGRAGGARRTPMSGVVGRGRLPLALIDRLPARAPNVADQNWHWNLCDAALRFAGGH
jgi:hypothetical protein